MMADWVRNYLSMAEWIGVRREAAFPKELAQYLED